MGNRAEQFRDHVFAFIVSDLVITAIGWIAFRVSVLLYDPSVGLSLFENLAVALCFLVIGGGALLWVRRGTPTFKHIESDFLLVRKDISIEYKNRDNATYRKKYRLRARRNNLDTFFDAYCWTGTSVESMSIANSNRQISEVGTRGPYTRIAVPLDRTVNKNDEIDVEIIWKLVDTERKAKPFISTIVNEPTKLLHFSIKLFDDGFDPVAICEQCPTSSARVNIHPIEKKFANNMVEWEITKPRLLHHYEVRWSGEQWR